MNKENSDTYSVACQCLRLLVFVLAAALVFGAVCVGGVSGAEFTVSAESNLASIVNNAGNGDVIVITGDYVISGQVVLSRNYNITITNAPGVDVTIRGNADAGPLFKIDSGTLTVKGNDDGGSLTITTGLNGRAFDVDSGAALNIYDGVIVYQCGFDSASSNDNNGGAVYVSNGGKFIMHGGLLLDNTGYKGGAVYVNDGGFFELKKGKGIITKNHALDIYGGAVYVEGGTFSAWLSESIEGCTASSNGGAVYVEGGTFRFGDSSQSGSGLIKDCTAEIGGAVYFADGTFSMEDNAKITGCTAEIGGAVYFADGTFNVMKWATIDSSNDVYLSAGQVITAANGYYGTIGKITLPSYEEGRNVVDVTADSDISITKFTLNPEAHNEYGDKLLVHVVEDGKDFLELKTQPVYRITIPDSLHISSEDKYGTMLITAETVKIPINSWLSVTVVSEGNFNLTNTADNSAKLPYNLFIDESGVRVKNNMEVAHFTVTEYLEKQSVSSKLTERLNGTVTELPPVTGTYTDILTFSVEYKTT